MVGQTQGLSLPGKLSNQFILEDDSETYSHSGKEQWKCVVILERTIEMCGHSGKGQ